VAETGSKRIRYDKHGVHVLGVVNVAGAAKDGEAGTSRTRVSSRQRVRVAERDGETITSEAVEISEGKTPGKAGPEGPRKEETE
jgi:hypothetical protein